MPTSASHRRVTARRVVDLAFPIVISNVTVPLIGLVDTAVMGHMPDASYIGAVALGALIFSFVYWGFGFLRMGTTGLTAQAYGRWQANSDSVSATELRAAFMRPLALAGVVAVVLVVLQWPIAAGAFSVLNGSQAVEGLAETYFYVRIWGAPFTLGSYAVLGWLLGQQATRAAVTMQIVTNLANVALSLLFVLGFGWGVAGVAAASVLAEAGGLALGIVLVRQRLAQATGSGRLHVPRDVLVDRVALKRLAGLNFDIFVRTLCLVFAFSWLTDHSAQMGDRVLAANTILLQFQTFLAFALDAFAFAAEALVGQAIGARDRLALRDSIRLTAWLSIAVAGLFALAYALLGTPIINALTDLPALREETYAYRWWMVVMPLIAVGSYLLDGVFIGATRSAEMRNAMIASVIVFIPAGYGLSTWYGNHGLWAAFSLFMLLRAVTLLVYLPRVMRDAAPAHD